MSLRPTNVPLTAKEFDEERCGLCFGCGCYCGYIAYLKEGKIADLYGHPHDPNGMGSLCTKGIALLQELPSNPLRVRSILIREGDTFREGGVEEIRQKIKGRVGIFLDRITTDLVDLLTAREVTDHVYSEALYLPFRASTLRPQEWSSKRVIVAFECDPVFSEVMSTRWVVDAVEKGAYLVVVSSRFGTLAQKATERFVEKPPRVVRFLESLADAIEGNPSGEFAEDVGRISRILVSLKEAVILIGDTLLRTPWRDNVLSALRRIRERTGTDYTVVGDVTPVYTKSLTDLVREADSLDTLILTGNPFMYLSDDDLEKLKGVFKAHLTLFPNLTANNSDAVIPVRSFQERTFTGFRNGFCEVRTSEGVLSSDLFTLSELLRELFSVSPKQEPEVPDLPPLEEADLDLKPKEVEEEGIYVLTDRTLVDEIGHWNPWTHEIERDQRAYMNERTADILGVRDRIEIGGVTFEVKVNNNIADDTVFIPDSFEETQPFDPGNRVGRILPEADLRVFRYR